MTVGPREIAKNPRSVFPLYELEMRLNELIEIHCALYRFCVSAEPSEESRRKPSSEQKSFAICYRRAKRPPALQVSDG